MKKILWNQVTKFAKNASHVWESMNENIKDFIQDIYQPERSKREDSSNGDAVLWTLHDKVERLAEKTSPPEKVNK